MNAEASASPGSEGPASAPTSNAGSPVLPPRSAATPKPPPRDSTTSAGSVQDRIPTPFTKLAPVPDSPDSQVDIPLDGKAVATPAADLGDLTLEIPAEDKAFLCSGAQGLLAPDCPTEAASSLVTAATERLQEPDALKAEEPPALVLLQKVVRSKKLLASVGLPEVARLQRVLFDALCEHQDSATANTLYSTLLLATNYHTRWALFAVVAERGAAGERERAA